MNDVIDEVQKLIDQKKFSDAVEITSLEFLQEVKNHLIEDFSPDKAYEYLQLLFLSLASRVGNKTKLDEQVPIYELGIEVESFYGFILRFHYEYFLYLKANENYADAYHYLYTYYEEQLNISFDELETVEIYRRFSEDLVKINRSDEALEYLFEAEKMMDLFIQINPRENAIMLSKIEKQIAMIFMNDYFYERALEFCENEEDLLLYLITEDMDFDLYLLANNYYRQALCHQNIKSFDNILPILDKAYSVLQKLSEDEYIKELKADIFSFKYQVHNHFNRLSEAEDNLIKSVELRKGLKVPETDAKLAEDFYSLGKISQRNKEYEKAIGFLNESFGLFSKMSSNEVNNLYRLGRIQHSLGQIYLAKKDLYLSNVNFLEAVNYYQRCVEVDKQEYQGDLIRCCIELGDQFFQNKKATDAISIYEIPLTYLNDLIKNNVSSAFGEYAHIVGNISQSYYLKKDFEKVIEWGESALDFYNFIYKKVFPANYKSMYEIIKVVAISYDKINKDDKAIEHLEKGVNLLRDILNNNDEEIILMLLDLLDNLINASKKTENQNKEIIYLKQMIELTENQEDKRFFKYYVKAVKKLRLYKT